jgi:hypothetical protein
MKSKLIITAIFASLLAMSALFSTPAHADGWRHGGGHYVWRGPNYGWVVPAVIGGAIVYEATRPVQPNVVVVQPQPVYPPPVAPVGAAPIGMHWEAILDANCNCYRTVLVQN